MKLEMWIRWHPSFNSWKWSIVEWSVKGARLIEEGHASTEEAAKYIATQFIGDVNEQANRH